MTFHLNRALLPAILACGLCALAQPGIAADDPAAAPPPAAASVAPAAPAAAAANAPANGAAPVAPASSAAPTVSGASASGAPPAGSAAPAGAAPAAAAAQPPVAQAPNASLIGPPPPGQGQVVFFRSWNILGAAISYIVREDKTELGEVTIGSYFVVPLDPGTHTFTVHSEVKDNLTLEVDAGETYYVQGSVGMGLVVGRPHIVPSDEATFDQMGKKLKRSTWTAPAQVAAGSPAPAP
ncbi:MAG TPA: DUF2846 domain-containing protein [Caulobacteraceae bacterium]|jgi:hypothetical protein|nr:DUF2846 domain-containing protein [Caulobacteraceae bacterium]